MTFTIASPFVTPPAPLEGDVAARVAEAQRALLAATVDAPGGPVA